MADSAVKPVIELKNVKKVYGKDVVGLKDINLTINKGEFVVIVGLSGAGKSTLLRSINRLIDITEGDILINGESITKAKGKELRMLRRNIGMIFQSFNLVKRSSVLRNVLTGRVGYYPTWKSTLNLFTKEDKQRAYDALQQVDLADKVYTRADELSGELAQEFGKRVIGVRAGEIIYDGKMSETPKETFDQIYSGGDQDE